MVLNIIAELSERVFLGLNFFVLAITTHGVQTFNENLESQLQSLIGLQINTNSGRSLSSASNISYHTDMSGLWRRISAKCANVS